MEILVEKDPAALAQRAREYLVSRLIATTPFRLGLAAGTTPLPLYQAVGHWVRDKKASLQHLFCFPLDEYVGLSRNDPRSFTHFLQTNVAFPWCLEEDQIRFWKGDALDREKECQTFEQAIQDAGGIDCQILGLGMNGHIGFNEPGSARESRCREVLLSQTTLSCNKPQLAGGFLPTHAFTMGVASILEAKNILLLISGRKKRESVERFLKEAPNAHFPATFLKDHPALTVICDKEAIDGLE